MRFPVNELDPDLFPDQLDAIWSTHAHVTEGAKRILGVACTGWGKTRTITNLAKGLGGRTLFIAHRRELIDQAAAAFSHQWPGVSVGRIDQRHHEPDAHVVIAMVQTLVGRLDRTPGPFDLIVVDEAHRITATTYQTILDHYCGTAGALDGFIPDTAPIVVGITATPRRTGEAGAVYDFFGGRVAFFEPTAKAIGRGRLCDFRTVEAAIDVDLDAVKKTGADFAQGDLGKALTGAGAPKLIADVWEGCAADRLTMVFAPTVDMAKLIAEEFRSRGIESAHIEGGTDADVRARTIARFKAGEIRVLSSVSTLTEGFDAPMTDCIVMARPTRSEIVFQQALGRGLRVHPGKADCLLINLTGNTKTKALATAEDLLGLHRVLAVNESAKAAMQRTETEEAEEAERTEQQRLVDEEESWTAGAVRMTDVDVMGRPRNCKHTWTAAPVDGCADRWVHGLDGGGEIVIRRSEPSARVWIAGVNAAGDDGMFHPTLVAKDPLISVVITEAERWIDGHRKENAWRDDPPTTRQLAYLESLGVDWRAIPKMTKAKAGRLIDEYSRQRKDRADRKTEQLRRTHTDLERITADAILAAAGRRAMLTGTIEEVEAILGVHFSTEWRGQAQARIRQVLEVAGDRGLLRRQGSSWVIVANERVSA